MLDEEVASFYVQQPNFFGLFEDAEAWPAGAPGGRQVYHGLQPHCSGHYEDPRDCGADIAVGEGQPLKPAFGLRRPRIWAIWPPPISSCASSPAASWARPPTIRPPAYVLSLQAGSSTSAGKRPAATSAPTGAVRPDGGAVHGHHVPDGMAQAAEQSMAKPIIWKRPVRPARGGAGIRRCVFPRVCPENAPQPGAAGGPGPPGHPGRSASGRRPALWCATEKVSRRELDEAVSIVKEVLDK